MIRDPEAPDSSVAGGRLAGPPCGSLTTMSRVALVAQLWKTEHARSVVDRSVRDRRRVAVRAGRSGRPQGGAGLGVTRAVGASHKRIRDAVSASATSLTDLFGVGPVLAAIVIGNTGDATRFRNRDHYAAYNGTAPVGSPRRAESCTDCLPSGTADSTMRSTWSRSVSSATHTPKAVELVRAGDRRTRRPRRASADRAVWAPRQTA